MNNFNVNSFCDNLDDDYGIFDDVADSLNFESVGIDTTPPAEDLDGDCRHNSYAWQANVIQPIQPIVPTTPTRPTKKRGRKPGQKPTCGTCGTSGHTKRTCGR